MRFEFADFVLDAERYELQRKGQPLRAEPQIIELLLLLLRNRERLVSKEEINQEVWRGRVVSDAALSSRIKTLRQLLGDDGRQQHIIRTVHKKGFRFLLPVTELGEDSAAELPASSFDTQATHSEGLAVKPGIAVMPFENLSAEADQEYFTDGVAADITTLLAKHRWISVVARNTTLGFKQQNLDARELGRLLGVDYIVEGSVRRSGSRVRVNVTLIDAHNGHQVWSDRYEREIDDIFAVQDEITEKIAARLEPEIGYAERNRVIAKRPANLQAWDCFHLGIYHFYQFTGPDNRKAQELLKQSQELDDRFGDAYAWWAYALVLGMVYWDTRPTQDLLDEALRSCDIALSLDRQNATFYALRGRVLLARREYDSAITDNKKAIALNPSFAAAHCGLGDSLAYEGMYDAALECFERALSLSPNDPQLWAFYSYGALVKIFKKDFAGALEWAQQATLIPNCQYWAYAHQAVANAYLGNDEQATANLNRVKELTPEFSVEFAREKMFYLKMPEQKEMYLEGLRKAGLS